LAVRLHNPQGVGDRVRRNGCDKTNESEAEKPHDQGVFRWLGDSFGEEVVLNSSRGAKSQQCSRISVPRLTTELEKTYRGKPRVVSHKRSSGSSKRSPPQTTNSIRLDAVAEQDGPASTLRLERCL
jgi:hypothetical protein